MNVSHFDIYIQIVVFLFAVCVHESAHAWMADRCGDPTAKMLGRITLNPIKHIDPFGTVLLPLIGLISGFGMFGWAKPCPVTPENFREPVRGDILTTAAGPVSNFILVCASMLVLVLISVVSPSGKEMVYNIAQGAWTDTTSPLMPIVWLLHSTLRMNVLLGVFNFIPIPPLDGSHILRHLLPQGARNAYDSLGMIGFIIAFMVGGPVLRVVMPPILGFLNSILVGITG